MEEKCLVCNNEYGTAAHVSIEHSNGDYRVDCPVCGRFDLERNADEDFLDPRQVGSRRLTLTDRARIAHRIRATVSPKDRRVPRVTYEFLQQFIASGCPGPTPGQQVINVIRYIGDQTNRTGVRIDAVPLGLFTIIGAPNPTFAGELLVEMKAKGLLDGDEENLIGATPGLLCFKLTLEGWQAYDEEQKGKISSRYGFLAMKFGDPILESVAHRVVKPTLKAELGFDVVDMRDVARAGIIDNIMRAQIRDAAFVLVDLTHDNSGAYWEAGYAEGLGKPVIYICEKQKFEVAQTHFDTNHCTTVIWAQENLDLFKGQLIATVRRSLNLF